MFTSNYFLKNTMSFDLISGVCSNSNFIAQAQTTLDCLMIRVSGPSGEMAKFNKSTMKLLDIATKVKKDFGIPRGEQMYYQGYNQ